MADKVVALVAQSDRPVRRMLLVGGVSQNRAMVASLQAKLPETELIVLPEGPYFEALGTAILTRKDPVYASPQLKIIASMDTLAPLAPCAERVQVISASPPDRSVAGPLVLGVDAGSTTTKAVLIDPRTSDIVASHYMQTNGDPLGATRQCLRGARSAGGQPPSPIGRDYGFRPGTHRRLPGHAPRL